MTFPALRASRSHSFVPGLALMLCMQAVPTATPTASTITEIPMPTGAVIMQALGVNSSGDAAGYYVLANGDQHGFTWSNGALSTLPPLALPGHGQTIAHDISDGGVVVGNSSPTFQPNLAVVWTNGQPESLGTFGGDWSDAIGVSTNGLVAGWAMVEPGSTRFHGFTYDGSSLHDVGVLLGGAATELNDINASGVAVGEGQVVESHFHAIRVDPVEGILDLGTLGGVTSEARAISDAGHIVGRAQTGERNDATFEGIVRHAFLWHQGKMIDLGTLPGLIESRAMGVNSKALVVGTANNETTTTTAPFLWRRGTMVDLNTLLPPGSGWTLRSANAISESGAIVGEGTHDGKPRAYVLQLGMPGP